jgi:hypothetical protein
MMIVLENEKGCKLEKGETGVLPEGKGQGNVWERDG